MKRLKVLNLFLLVLLGLAAGSAKVAKTPEELVFFLQVGLSEIVLVIFGAIQILAGLLMILKQYRVIGVCVLTMTFLVSSAMIFSVGQIWFGLFSLLPVMMAFFAYKYPLSKQASQVAEM